MAIRIDSKSHRYNKDGKAYYNCVLYSDTVPDLPIKSEDVESMEPDNRLSMGPNDDFAMGSICYVVAKGANPKKIIKGSTDWIAQ